MKKCLIAASAALTLSLLTYGTAQAEYPSKPVSFVVPFPPGDLEDVTTRMIANDFQKTYGVPSAVLNKPGGGGGPFPGAVGVAKAKADGATIGSFVIDVPLVGPHIGIPDLNPNPFEPVGIFLTYPFVIVAAKDAPYKTLEEMAKHAKENRLALGHFGAPLIPSQVTIALGNKMGFEWGSETGFDALDCNTLASGDVDVMNTTLQLVQPCLDKITILASVTEERLSNIPNVRTIGEIFPDLKIGLWNGLFVHKDTTAEVRSKIAASAMKTVLGSGAQKLAKQTGAKIYWQDANEANKRMLKDAKTLETLSKLLAN